MPSFPEKMSIYILKEQGKKGRNKNKGKQLNVELKAHTHKKEDSFIAAHNTWAETKIPQDWVDETRKFCFLRV